MLNVEPEPGSTLTEGEIRDVCRLNLAAFEQPARILVSREEGGVELQERRTRRGTEPEEV